ncbi:MAG TPA: diguanylate cyclase [Legionella sp.]|nr:diguanylate cyclase [Legionella sp.]
MRRINQLLSVGNTPLQLAEEHRRKYQLINIITIELLAFTFVLIVFHIYIQFWIVSVFLIIGSIGALLNLFLLIRQYSIRLCGYIISALCFSLVSIVNLWSGGVFASYVGFFYIAPLVAAITIGLRGLIIYSVLSLIMLLIFISGYIPPLHIIPDAYKTILNNVNYIFVFLIIFTTLYNLLSENTQYVSLLKEQNFLLHADKQKFHYLSHHDSLTNLPNRSYFNNHLQSLIEVIKPHKSTLTLYFMDLDGFKKINDKYGHEVGDLLLLHASKRLQSCFRENDFIARLGGDEFTAAITHQKNDKVDENLVTRINDEFKKPFYIKKLEIICPISIGTADYPADAQDADNLLKLADEAMYQIKRNKKIKLKH